MLTKNIPEIHPVCTCALSVATFFSSEQLQEISDGNPWGNSLSTGNGVKGQPNIRIAQLLDIHDLNLMLEKKKSVNTNVIMEFCAPD